MAGIQHPDDQDSTDYHHSDTSVRGEQSSRRPPSHSERNVREREQQSDPYVHAFDTSRGYEAEKMSRGHQRRDQSTNER